MIFLLVQVERCYAAKPVCKDLKNAWLLLLVLKNIESEYADTWSAPDMADVLLFASLTHIIHIHGHCLDSVLAESKQEAVRI